MTNSISQRISLEGADQVKKQLDDIGRSGADAFAKLQSSAAGLKLDDNAFPKIKLRLAEIGTAAGELGAQFSRLGDAFVSSGKRVAVFGAAAAGVVGVLGRFLSSTSDIADTIAKTAESLGISTQAFQQNAYAASQAGVNLEDYTKAQGKLAAYLDQQVKQERDQQRQYRALNRELSLGRISFEQYGQRVQDLRYQFSQQEGALDRLGVKIARNADGTVNAVETELRLADAFKDSTDSVLKAAAAREIYGRSGVRYVNYLSQGREAILAEGREAQRLGLILDQDLLKRQEKVNDAFDRFGKAVTASRVGFADAFSGTAVRVLDHIVEALARSRGAFIQLGETINRQIQPIVTDFLALLQGRTDLVQTSWVRELAIIAAESAKGIAYAFTGIIVPAVRAFYTFLQVVADAFNQLFGTNISAGSIIAAAAVLKLLGVFNLLSAAIGVAAAAIKLLIVAFGGWPVVIAAVAAGLAVLIYNWVGGITGIQNAWASLVAYVSAIPAQIAAFFVTLWTTITAGFVAAWITVSTATTGILTALWTSVVTGFTTAWTTVTTIVATAIQGLSDGWTAFMQVFVNLPAVMAQIFVAVGQAMQSAFFTAVDALRSYFQSWVDWVRGIISSIKSAIGDLVGSIQSAFSAGGGQGFAFGGPVRGQGSSTSDSIPAFLSNGEYVVRASAVQKYGVGLLNALNAMRIDPHSFARFANGGLVDALAPLMPAPLRFAEGDLVPAANSMRPINLTIGADSFAGLLAPDDVAKKLMTVAASRQLRSAGRKPSYYGNGR